MTETASGKLGVAQTAVPARINRDCEIFGICKRKRCEKDRGRGLWRHDMLGTAWTVSTNVRRHRGGALSPPSY